MILLNPGPVNLSDGVRQALAGPDLCHREAEFGELQETIRRGLLAVYGLAPEQWAAVLLGGSGTAAMEAMMTSLIPRQGKVLVVENGVYGERLSAIAQIHHIELQALHYAWGESIDLHDLDRHLDTDRAITHVALVHHETTTGLLNPLREVGELCRARDIGLLVDGVSSFAGEEFDFAGWGISACAGTSNKCLHGVPGVAFVLVRRDLLPGTEDNPQRTLYLDLAHYCREQDARSTPFTQSVQAFYALAQALRELAEQGGWQPRHEHYRRLAQQVRQGLGRLDIRPLLPEQDTSVVLSAFYLPDHVSYAQLHDGLKLRGFVIYAGQGALARNIFRVSTMGAIKAEDMERFLSAIEEIVMAQREKSAGRHKTHGANL
jgi:2-aminoethylphosphonate-pyruvate transaminase